MTTTIRSRSLVALGAVPLLVAALAGCTSGGGTDGTEQSVEEQARTWDLALADCVRDAGFEMDDPTGGGVRIDGGDEDLDAKFAAMASCRDEVVAEHGERPVSEKEREEGEKASKEWQKIEDCLEDHGIEMPDPDSSGLVTAPEVPDAVAEACGAAGAFAPAGGE